MIEQNRIQRVEEGKIQFTNKGEVTEAIKDGEQIGAIPNDPRLLQGYIMALNQFLIKPLTVPQMVEFRQKAGQMFEQGGE